MSRIEWPKVKLADHVDLLSGFPFKSAGFSTASDDTPLVKGENVHQGFVDWNKAKRWPKNQVDGLDKYWLKPGDVVLAMDRPWIEAGLKQACIREHDPSSLLVQRVSRLRGENGLLTDYLRHLIGSSMFTDYIKPIVTGTSVPHISGAQIKGFEFRLPPLPMQRRIASILSAYDDLIENNTRRIAILEEMARRLFEEWFVRFRFPGHEGVPMVESELGLVPQGWQRRSLDTFGEVITGKTPSKANPDFYGDDVPFVKTPDMHGNAFVLVSGESLSLAGAKSQSKKTLPSGSLCVSCIGTIGVVSITTEPCQTNQQINSIVLSDVVAREFLFLRLKDAKKTLENLGANGATMGNVNKSNFAAMEITAPPLNLLARFHEVAEPMFDLMRALARKNQNLRTTRDLLLPKLISGELDVSTLAEPLAETP